MQLTSPRILIADDHDWMRSVIVQIVARTIPGAEIVSVGDGTKAFSAYQKWGADFVITNHSMPGMDGAALTRALRKREPRLPILMVSSDPGNEAAALKAGANWFVGKANMMDRIPEILRLHTQTTSKDAPPPGEGNFPAVFEDGSLPV